MKTTIFRKLIIFIALFLSFGLNNSFAENRSIDEIKSEIEILTKQHENSENDLEKNFINEKISKLMDEFLEKNPKVNKINPYIQSRAWWRVSEWYETLETWDIIVVKWPERNSWWAKWWWTHALIIYDRNTVFEIRDVGYKSDKYHISRIRDMIISWNYKEFAVLKMWLTYSEKEDMKNYITKNLMQKDYDYPPYDLSSYSKDVYYCSSLVWKAHIKSWKKIDLDYDWFVTYPQDLILSNKYNSINYYKY